MIEVSTQSKEDPPEILYKYISQTGLLGAFKSRSLWATDIFFMNDAAEYQYAVNMLKGNIKDRLKVLGESHKGLIRSFGDVVKKFNKENIQELFLTKLADIIEGLIRFNIFVCSFTEEKDLLSQWRGYCPHGNGYSIGFNSQSIIKSFSKNKFTLIKCLYNKDKQLEIIDNLVHEAIDELPDEVDADLKLLEDLVPNFGELITQFLQLAPRFKHHTFHEEKEWRFVSRSLEFAGENVKYRQGLSMVIPYTENKLLDDNGKLPIENIIIGPTQLPDLSFLSIEGLLKTYGYKNVKVESSKIPYREW